MRPYLFAAVDHELHVGGELRRGEVLAVAARLVLEARRGRPQRVVAAQHALLLARHVDHRHAGQLVTAGRVMFIMKHCMVRREVEVNACCGFDHSVVL